MKSIVIIQNSLFHLEIHYIFHTITIRMLLFIICTLNIDFLVINIIIESKSSYLIGFLVVSEFSYRLED